MSFACRSFAHYLLFYVGIVLVLTTTLRVGATEPPIDLNTAGAALLAERLPGIGPSKAKAIVAYREQHGSFKTLDELTEVKGIGPRTLDKIRALLVIDKNTPASVSDGAASATTPSLGDAEKKVQRAVRAAVSVARRNRQAHSN